MKTDVIYYRSESQEFSNSSVKPVKIDGDYVYIKNGFFYKVASFISYRLIATPIAFFYKLFKGIKIVNKKALKDYKREAIYIYANHTNAASDVLMPHMITFPRKLYTIVGSENMNLPVIKKGTRMLGAIPIANTIGGTKNFITTIKSLAKASKPLLIYPEAHIWPYYTKIRNFSEVSFRYPVENNLASFTFTTTYQKSKLRKYKTVIYVDGPFYPDSNLDFKEKQINLRDQVYQSMVERAKLSNYEKIQYIKEDTNE